jgi:hypothetical protein
LKIFHEYGISYHVKESFRGLLGTQGKRLLRFDFAIFNPDGSLKCLVECQGEQHFVAIEKFGGEDRLIKQKERDLEKYRILKEQGKEIIYFVDPTLIRSKYRNEILNEHIPNYFGKVYTDLNKIGLIIASRINY